MCKQLTFNIKVDIICCWNFYELYLLQLRF